MKSTMNLYQQQREPLAEVSDKQTSLGNTLPIKRTNDRLREDANTVSANTEKGNIIQASASGGQANDLELMELGNTMKGRDNGYQDVSSPQHMEHSMMDRSGSVFLDNSYVDHNQQYGLDYI